MHLPATGTGLDLLDLRFSRLVQVDTGGEDCGQCGQRVLGREGAADAQLDSGASFSSCTKISVAPGR